VEYYCEIPETSRKKLKEIYDRQEFSARSYFRILKTARTIADLEGSEKILERHVNEALRFKITNLKEE
jgi:magnesium chelatase family protein